MGFVRVRTGLYNPLQPEKVIEVDAIVDTGGCLQCCQEGFS